MAAGTSLLRCAVAALCMLLVDAQITGCSTGEEYDAGTTSCQACTQGKYSDTTNRDACISCPVHSSTAAGSAESRATCTCDATYYLKVPTSGDGTCAEASSCTTAAVTAGDAINLDASGLDFLEANHPDFGAPAFDWDSRASGNPNIYAAHPAGSTDWSNGYGKWAKAHGFLRPSQRMVKTTLGANRLPVYNGEDAADCEAPCYDLDGSDICGGAQGCGRTAMTDEASFNQWFADWYTDSLNSNYREPLTLTFTADASDPPVWTYREAVGHGGTFSTVERRTRNIFRMTDKGFDTPGFTTRAGDAIGPSRSEGHDGQWNNFFFVSAAALIRLGAMPTRLRAGSSHRCPPISMIATTAWRSFQPERSSH